ncbi:MAG: hypothetical protein IIC67_10330 [Thaumarchaeota archaeon]|nr:hypothetical protein [Nitrososphaerota archaeon]
MSIANNCQNEQCIQNSNNILNGYHIGALILSVGSIVVLIRELKSS